MHWNHLRLFFFLVSNTVFAYIRDYYILFGVCQSKRNHEIIVKLPRCKDILLGAQRRAKQYDFSSLKNGKTGKWQRLITVLTRKESKLGDLVVSTKLKM